MVASFSLHKQYTNVLQRCCLASSDFETTSMLLWHLQIQIHSTHRRSWVRGSLSPSLYHFSLCCSCGRWVNWAHLRSAGFPHITPHPGSSLPIILFTCHSVPLSIEWITKHRYTCLSRDFFSRRWKLTHWRHMYGMCSSGWIVRFCVST